MNYLAVILVLGFVAASHQATRYNARVFRNSDLCESTPKPVSPLVEYPLALTQLEAAELGLAPFPLRYDVRYDDPTVPISYNLDDYPIYYAAPYSPYVSAPLIEAIAEDVAAIAAPLLAAPVAIAPPKVCV